MAHSLRFLPAAADDLIALYNYVAAESDPATAIGYIERIERACGALRDFPRSGKQYKHRGGDLRTIGFERRVVIAYLVGKQEIQVARVLYGGRDVERALLSLLAARGDAP